MSIKIGIGYKEKLTSEALNKKFGNIVSPSNVIVNQFNITPFVSDIGVTIHSGKAIIEGAIVECNTSNDLAIAQNTSGSDILYNVIVEYNHILSEVNYAALTIAEYNSLILTNNNLLVLGTVNVRDGATTILNADITLSDVADAISLESVYDEFKENTDNLLIPSKDLIEQINASVKVEADTAKIEAELANLKLYQDANERIQGTDLILYGTDFVADLETTRNEEDYSLIASASSGQNEVEVSSTANLEVDQEITLEEGSNIERAIISTLTTGGAQGFGSSTNYSGNDANGYFDIAQLEANKFVCVYICGANHDVEAVICTVDGYGNVTVGSPALMVTGADSLTYVKACKTNTDKFYMIYKQSTGTVALRGRGATVSGTSVTPQGTDVNIAAATIQYIDVAQVDTDKIIMIWGDSGTGQTNAQVHTVDALGTINASGTAIMIDDNGYGRYITAISHEPNKVIVSLFSDKVRAGFLIISGTTISISVAPSIVSTYTNINDLTAGMIADNYVAFAYLDASSLTNYIRIYEVRTTDFYYPHNQEQIAPVIYGHNLSIGGILGNGDFLFIYRDTNDSYTGKYRIMNWDGVTLDKGTIQTLFDIEPTMTSDTVLEPSNGGSILIMSRYNLAPNNLKFISYVKSSGLIQLNSNLVNSYTPSAILYRSNNNEILNGETKDIRMDIENPIAKSAASAIVYCTKATGLTYQTYISIVDSINDEVYYALTQSNDTDLGDGTQELIFNGEVPTPANKVTLKLVVTNASGSTATVSKILGALE